VSVTVCPKCGGRGYRVYAQAQDPKRHASTAVGLPYVLCGSPLWADGAPRFVVGEGQDGLIAIDPHLAAVRARSATARAGKARRGVATGPRTHRSATKGKKRAATAKRG
jgi:hypothetical protein